LGFKEVLLLNNILALDNICHMQPNENKLILRKHATKTNTNIFIQRISITAKTNTANANTFN
jgi:hypothetical protein